MFGGFDMSHGLLLIDKEEGVTSRDVDNEIKKKFHVKSVGHLGTLDPFATGLLVIGLGEGTKMFSYLNDDRKTYIATLKLGEKTDTGDKTGKLIERMSFNNLSNEKIIDVLNSFKGIQLQIPPSYSAKHIDGKRAYDLAREGKEVVLKPQKIEIYSIELIESENDIVVFKCDVSKGTYIRTLGEDIAKRLGTVGHLTGLRRVTVGDFDVSKAKKIDEVNENDIIPVYKSIKESSLFFVDESNEKIILNGNKFKNDSIKSNYFFSFNKIGKLVNFYERDGEEFKCLRGFGISYKNVPVYRLSTLNEIKNDGNGIALAIGEFDCLHKGHLNVLEKLKKSKLKKYVLSFSDDFKTRIRGSNPDFIMSTNNKVDDIKKLGFIDGIIVLDYDENLVKLNPNEFIDNIIKPINTKEIYIGTDFTFGYKGIGKPTDFINQGFKVDIVDLITDNNYKISTTLCKSKLKDGLLEDYVDLCSHYYSFESTVLHGFKEGRKIGFPTLNMSPLNGQIIPKNGVYKTYTIVDGIMYHSMTNIGVHPTINKLDKPIIETTILDNFNKDVYGQKIRIIFERAIREETKFDSIFELKNQLKIDEDICSEGILDLSISDYPLL